MQNYDAWIQELMFQLRIIWVGPLKYLQKGHLASGVWEAINAASM